MKFVIATVAALGLAAPAFAGSVAPADEEVTPVAAAGGSLGAGAVIGLVALLVIAAASDSSSGTP